MAYERTTETTARIEVWAVIRKKPLASFVTDTERGYNLKVRRVWLAAMSDKALGVLALIALIPMVCLMAASFIWP